MLTALHRGLLRTSGGTEGRDRSHGGIFGKEHLIQQMGPGFTTDSRKLGKSFPNTFLHRLIIQIRLLENLIRLLNIVIATTTLTAAGIVTTIVEATSMIETSIDLIEVA
eukprot:Rmarinus@m.8370